MESNEGKTKVTLSSEQNGAISSPPVNLEEELDKAFASANKTVELGRQLQYKRNMVNHFSAAVMSTFPTKAPHLKRELTKLKRPARKRAGWELFKTANMLGCKGNDIEALLFARLAADEFEKEGFCEGIGTLCEVVLRVGEAKIRNSNDKSFVKLHILPLVKEVRLKAKRIHSTMVNEKVRVFCDCEVRCVAALVEVYQLLDDPVNTEQ